jgi:hypothetical protein
MKIEVPCRYSLSTKVEYATDITLGRIVKLKSYRGQRKKGPKSFVIVGATTAFLFLVFLHCVYLKCFSAILFIVRFCDSMFLKRFCGYSCFDLLELPEASRSEWN